MAVIETSAASPDASEITVRATAPASSGAAAAVSGASGIGSSRVEIVPAAQEKAESNSSTASPEDRLPSPAPCAATSSATPANPAASATEVRSEGRPAPVSPHASSGTKSGIVARNSAATPEGTCCSSRASSP